MAFIPGSIANTVTKQKEGSFVPGSIANTITRPTNSTFTPGSIAGQTGVSSKSLKSASGLYDIAVQSGLQKRADKILKSQSGEDIKKIFSGGTITDIFDVMNALDYGVVGVLKGKSFKEGVETRQSFSDKDSLGKYGLPGVVGGVLLDIAVDPLTYIAPWTILKKIPGATKVGKAVKTAAVGERVTKAIQGTNKTYQAVEGGTRIGKYLAQKFTWMNGADPIFRETFERGLKNTAISAQQITDLGKTIAKLEPSTASKLIRRGADGRFERVPIEELQKILKPEELEPVAKLVGKIQSLGKEAVDLKLLSKGKYEEGINTYLKNAYLEYEQAVNKGTFGFNKVGIKGIKNRVEDLSLDKMKELGQIDNPAYLLFKSAFDLSKDVENAKLLKAIDSNFGTKVAQEGFELIPKTPKWGSLGGKYIPKHMSEYIREVIEPASDSLGKQIIAGFKFAKVILNPGTHARNIVSNKILNYWKLGMNPLDPRVFKTDATALAEIARGTGKWSDEAKQLGYNLDTFASAEMKNLLDSADASVLGKSKSLWGATKKKLGDLYQAEENHAKLSAYIYQRTVKKLDPENAWKAAESATFNYAQVTPFVRKLRESIFGMPFITFTVKATPVAIETALKNTNRVSVIGKIKNSIEDLADIKETEEERANEPSWVKDGFYVKLPMKDKEGRSAYFDLTYILPFGDIVSGNFFERSMSTKTGLPESATQTVLNKSPFIQVVGSLYRNRDFYGNSIFKESDPTEKQLKDIMTFLTKSYAPPLVADQLPGGYNDKGERQNKGIKTSLDASEENQKRNLSQELLRNVGIKVQPIDADIQETYQEYNKRKALQNLLKENGIINEMDIYYQPK